MAFPKTEEEMYNAGYRRMGTTICSSKKCGMQIQWWETRSGKKLPMDLGTATPHWATCLDSDKFRKVKK